MIISLLLSTPFEEVFDNYDIFIDKDKKKQKKIGKECLDIVFVCVFAIRK